MLGCGGMGAVYRAIQKSLGRQVAIKLLPPELADDPAFAERFKREARALAELNHTNIVQIYDFGETKAGHFYFVMEFVDGCDFHKLIQAGELDSGKTLHAVSQICDALAYAHGKGYIHRDIKPANIFLNGEGIVKVGDFGLAKLIDAEDDENRVCESLLTMTGTTVGTPQYIAPEALTGSGVVDQRADVYSLGIMFYEMLTGQVPRGAFDPPSKKVEIDVRLDDVVLRAMAETPERRYQSAVEVRRDIDEIRSSMETPEALEGATKTTFGWLAWVCGLVALSLAIYGGYRLGGPAIGMRTAVDHAREAIADPGNATKEIPFENSIGMRFVPVQITGGPTDGKSILFNIWETRIQDYRLFVNATGRSWKGIFWDQDDSHPVVGVTWEDAIAFCEWLTEIEQEKGLIARDRVYRLPSDHEWSCSVGLGDKEDPGTAPVVKGQAERMYPWGDSIPPPPGSGNFMGEEIAEVPSPDADPIKGYSDGFPWTAPVGSFSVSPFGLYDSSGNVWEWCLDWYDPGNPVQKVMRGGAWNCNHTWGMRPSDRYGGKPVSGFQVSGFRIVLAN